MSLDKRVKKLEQSLSQLSYNLRGIVQSEFQKSWADEVQSESLYGLYLAMCVDTEDPWKQGRIRFFCPLIHDTETPIKALPWADTMQAMAGIDDSGMVWVPPAGSMVGILFQNGMRDLPFYIGGTWYRNWGSDFNKNWGYPINEFYKIWSGKRHGYAVGENNKEVLPPWNTESYNGYDISSISDFENDPEAQKRVTYPNIYGYKTPEKHMLKFVDGNHKCNKRWKRLELRSSTGHFLIMKDDHLHAAGQWANPNCVGTGKDDLNPCSKEDDPDSPGLPESFEKTDCDNKSISGGSPDYGHDDCKKREQTVGANPYYKRLEECRPYQGAGTPQNNKCELPQAGVQIQSISGHQLVLDDSVEEPSGVPDWSRALEPFDFGCTDRFFGKMFMKSTTGHRIELSDVEKATEIRGSEEGECNGIKFVTASGTSIELNDDTLERGEGEGCVAGKNRGITMETTSKHTLQMIDEGNSQCSPPRREGGEPVAKATNGYCLLRSGYGLEISLYDSFNQEETDQQYIRIFAPQKDNTERGAHIMRFQERNSGPGVIFLRAGGIYWNSSYDDSITTVGTEENPSNKLDLITDNWFVDTKKVYFHHSDKTIYHAERFIALLAGRDCEDSEGSEAPCVFPVLVAKKPWQCPFTSHVHWGNTENRSDRVFASMSD